MKTIALILIACMAAGLSSCSKKNDNVHIPNAPHRTARQLVEDAAIRFVARGGHSRPDELQASASRKDDHWIVCVSGIPAVPSGAVFVSVSFDGVIENMRDIRMREMLEKLQKERAGEINPDETK